MKENTVVVVVGIGELAGVPLGHEQFLVHSPQSLVVRQLHANIVVIILTPAKAMATTEQGHEKFNSRLQKHTMNNK